MKTNINQKINILHNSYGNNTQSNGQANKDEALAKARGFSWFTPAFTRSQVYDKFFAHLNKQIEENNNKLESLKDLIKNNSKIPTGLKEDSLSNNKIDFNAPKIKTALEELSASFNFDINNLSLRDIGITEQGLFGGRINDYLAEIKSAFLSDDTAHLGKDYSGSTEMGDIIKNFRKKSEQAFINNILVKAEIKLGIKRGRWDIGLSDGVPQHLETLCSILIHVIKIGKTDDFDDLNYFIQDYSKEAVGSISSKLQELSNQYKINNEENKTNDSENYLKSIQNDLTLVKHQQEHDRKTIRLLNKKV